MELKKYKLGDIAKIEISGVDKKSVDGETPVRLCNFVDVYRNWAITQKLSENFMIASAKETEIAKCSIHKGQVAITKDSETRDDIGIPAYIADDFDNVLLGYHCALITPNDDVLDGKYLNAFMHTRYIQKYFENNASGSGQRYTLSNETIFQIPILLPSLEVQKAIGNLLSNIDRKIELNRQINDNLEKMAKQLYDYWFVQFDFPNENGRPYKSSGGAMVWNEKLKREIPKEWDNCTLEYYLIIKNGRDHKHLGNGIYPVYGSGGEIRKVDSFIYSGESILMPRKGSLNNIMYVNDAFWSVDTMFYSEMKQPHCAKYVFYSIKDIDFTRWDSGTGVPSMTSSTLYSILLVKPDADSLAKFDEIITPLFLMIKKNEMQIVELTKQRDDLLPLLMNGQASVNYHLSHD
ncbi:restriction endonuclease subunit S [Phocaeicola vulgatus]|jgi:type I restriction enzyme S subunit|uniref:Type I restriction modification DNA specificity domain protein n=1 Tax=Bacteroides clarus YIT 12056 TaxID=762984 RepID=A0ABN0CQ31_9BACE|nr:MULTISPECIES: restriction endonuclease subunit S [Bacteroides]EGF53016.1 type I restriction modification DNA specificity domain protein [Bacteroides clarus YIT 12056]MCS2376235.1 restriction endonuclease subunit S [Bacteroides fragilis]MCZ2549740.1 restriction endonuclease subunit S [Bacteroides fragilis]SHG54471.1 type I restriction enzyme, S subunit [Bacteroides clarus YIT 12056]